MFSLLLISLSLTLALVGVSLIVYEVWKNDSASGWKLLSISVLIWLNCFVFVSQSFSLYKKISAAQLIIQLESMESLLNEN